MPSSLYDDCISMLDEKWSLSLLLLIMALTFFTSNHTLVQKSEIVPSIADHDIVVADIKCKTTVRTAKAYISTIIQKS